MASKRLIVSGRDQPDKIVRVLHVYLVHSGDGVDGSLQCLFAFQAAECLIAAHLDVLGCIFQSTMSPSFPDTKLRPCYEEDLRSAARQHFPVGSLRWKLHGFKADNS